MTNMRSSMVLMLTGGVLLACHREPQPGVLPDASESESGSESESEGETDGSSDLDLGGELGADDPDEDPDEDPDRPPGAVVWRELYDIAATPKALAVAGNGSLGLLLDDELGNEAVLVFDADGTLTWTADPPSLATAIAGGPSGEFVVAGQVDGVAVLQRFEPDGAMGWTWSIEGGVTTRIWDLAVDERGVTSVGSLKEAGDIFGVGAIFRHRPDGTQQYYKPVLDSVELHALTLQPDGSVWVLADTARIEHFDEFDHLVWSSPVAPLSEVHDLAVDPLGQATVIGSLPDAQDGFALTTFDVDGAGVWSRYHDDRAVLEAANAVVALPSGEVVVVGDTNRRPLVDSGDGLVSVYGPDAVWRGDFIYGGDEFADVDTIEKVALAPDGTVVTAGRHCRADGCQLWLMKLAM